MFMRRFRLCLIRLCLFLSTVLMLFPLLLTSHPPSFPFVKFMKTWSSLYYSSLIRVLFALLPCILIGAHSQGLSREPLGFSWGSPRRRDCFITTTG